MDLKPGSHLDERGVEVTMPVGRAAVLRRVLKGDAQRIALPSTTGMLARLARMSLYFCHRRCQIKYVRTRSMARHQHDAVLVLHCA